MDFEILGEIAAVEPIAIGNRIRVLRDLERRYGKGRWRKLKGIATLRLPNGAVRKAEIHWYEAHGIGRRRLKVKFFLD